MSPHHHSVSPKRNVSKSAGRYEYAKSTGRYVECSRSRSRTPPRRRHASGIRRRSSGSSSGSGECHSSHYRRRYTRSPTRSRSSSDSRSPTPPRGTRERPFQSRCIGVFGLSVHTTQQKIRELFSKFGAIERIQVVIDAQTGRSRGFCFIYYHELTDARAAKHECSGMELDGRRIRVDYSITQRAHTPTPGVYMGRPVARNNHRGRESRRSVGRRRSRSTSRDYHRSRRERSYRSRSHTSRYSRR